MTPLRQKLIDEIQLRGFSPHTQDSYVRVVAGIARFYHRSPDQIQDEELKDYLLHLLRDKGLAVSSLAVAVSGLRFFFGTVLHRSTTALEQALPRMKKPVVRPRVYSVQEMERLFNGPKLNPMHRTLLETTYAAGLRVSEVCHLRIADLLTDRHQIHVVQGKGQNYAKVVVMERCVRYDGAGSIFVLHLAGDWGRRKAGEVYERAAFYGFRPDPAALQERPGSSAHGRQLPWHNAQPLRLGFAHARIHPWRHTFSRPGR
jgi:integrase